MTDDKKLRLGLSILSAILQLAGFLFVLAYSWQLATGLFLIQWGINFERAARDRRGVEEIKRLIKQSTPV